MCRKYVVDLTYTGGTPRTARLSPLPSFIIDRAYLIVDSLSLDDDPCCCTTMCCVLSYVDVRQYSMALEHISAREGTGIPTGAAEQALAFLHRHGEEVWPFLAQHLAGTEQKQSDHVVDVSQAPARYSDEAPSAGNDNRLPEKDGVVVQHKRDRGNKQAAPVNGDEEAAYTLDQVSAALEMFGRERHTRGDAVEELAFRDLNNYLYLGGQTKVRRFR